MPSPPAGASRRPATARAADGGTLIIAIPGDADHLLPPVVGTQVGNHIVERIFSRLAELKPGLNTVDDSGFSPLLARSWEHRDSTTIVFHMDPRARWQDGAPVTAGDVVYTFKVYRDPATESPFRVNLDPITSVTALDSMTVAFAFHRWYPEQLYDATYHLRILPRHLLDSIPDNRLVASSFATAPVGAGPFRFTHWEPGTEIAVAADSAWFLGRPHLSRIVWRVMPDVSASVTALLAGEADAMEFIPQRDEIERVQHAPNLTLLPYPSPFLGGLLFNLRRPLFADRSMRRALGMTIDRETIVRSVFGPWADVAVGGATKMQWIAAGPIRQLPFDKVASTRLLDSLGWRRGADGLRRRAGQPLQLRLMTPTTSRVRQEIAVHIQNELKLAGVTVTIEPVEITVFNRRIHDGDFDALMFSRTLDPSPSGLAQFWSSASVGADNQGAYRSPGFDSLLAAASAARGRAQAEPLWRAALERLNDDAPRRLHLLAAQQRRDPHALPARHHPPRQLARHRGDLERRPGSAPAARPVGLGRASPFAAPPPPSSPFCSS